MKLKHLQITEELHSRLQGILDQRNRDADFHKYSLTELACEAVEEYLDKRENEKK